MSTRTTIATTVWQRARGLALTALCAATLAVAPVYAQETLPPEIAAADQEVLPAAVEPAIPGDQAGGTPLPAHGEATPVALMNASDVAALPHKVVMVDNRMLPGTVTVPVGATVAWINQGANIHTVSGYDSAMESGAVARGKAFTYTFTAPGEYQYLCRQHLLNGMTGTITVQ